VIDGVGWLVAVSIAGMPRSPRALLASLTGGRTAPPTASTTASTAARLSGRTAAALLLVPLVALGLAACKKDTPENASDLPDGASLLSDSATAMKDVESVHIVLDIDGTIAALPIKRADGDVKRGGDAKGSIQLISGPQLIEVQFIIIGDAAWLKYPTGDWTLTPGIKSVYDPGAILDEQHGVANLLSTVSNAKTEGSESIGGVDTYRVGVTPDKAAAAYLVPGVPDGLTAKVWVDKATKHMVKLQVNIPAAGSSAAATATFNLTNFNTPVTVDAP
jgi:lipoprotein LprG